MSGAVLVSRMYISIPAPARGRTTLFGAIVFLLIISIPAPARGRTISSAFNRSLLLISIPAPARGRTLFPFLVETLRNFNSRPREGANSQQAG